MVPLASQAASLSTELSHPAVVIRGGENQRFRGKPPALDRRPLPCHILTPGIDPGLQQWQASDLITALSRPIIYILSHEYINCILLLQFSLQKWSLIFMSEGTYCVGHV